MSRGLNKVMLIGNLGTDPEVRSTANGDRVVTLSVATNYSFKNRDGDKITRTEWHRVIAWRGLADIAERFLVKGSKLYAEGRLQTRKWEDKEGNTKFTTEIVASELTLLDSGKPKQKQEKEKETEESIQDAVRGKNADEIMLEEIKELYDDMPF